MSTTANVDFNQAPYTPPAADAADMEMADMITARSAVTIRLEQAIFGINTLSLPLVLQKDHTLISTLLVQKGSTLPNNPVISGITDLLLNINQRVLQDLTIDAVLHDKDPARAALELSTPLPAYSVHDLPVTLSETLQTAVAIDAEIHNKDRVQKAVTLSMRQILQGPVDLSTPYGIKVQMDTSLYADISDKEIARAALTLSLPVSVQAAMDLNTSYGLKAQSAVEIDAGLLVKVAQDYTLPTELLAKDPVKSATTLPIAIDSSTVVVYSDRPFILIDGIEVGIVEGEVSCDEGSPFWEGQFTLADEADFLRFTINKAVTIDIYGDTYSMIVENATRSREGVAGITFTVRCVSPGIQLTSPRHDGITQENATAVMAQTYAASLATGFTLHWDIHDWSIPAYRIQVEDAEPLEVIKKIAEAAGGVLQSDKDGSLRVRYAFPVSPVVYDSTAEDITLSSNLETFKITEEHELRLYYDKLDISDVADGEFQDSLVYDEEAGLLRAFLYPFDPNATVEHTSGSYISLSRIGVVTETIGQDEDEIIEIVEGVGNAKFPITSIITADYMEDNLGSVSFDPDTSEIRTATAGYSLVRLVYTTRSIQYNVASAIDTQAQFLLKRNT